MIMKDFVTIGDNKVIQDNDNCIIIEGKKIPLSDETIEEIKNKFIKNDFEPKKGEMFYSLDRNGLIRDNFKFDYYESTDDMDIFYQGNLFKTREEAEKERNKRIAIMNVKKYIHDNNLEFEPNWGNNNDEIKYHILYHINQFEAGYCWNFKNPFSAYYFKSRQDTEKVINDCKYYLKIIFDIK